MQERRGDNKMNWLINIINNATCASKQKAEKITHSYAPSTRTEICINEKQGNNVFQKLVESVEYSANNQHCSMFA